MAASKPPSVCNREPARFTPMSWAIGKTFSLPYLLHNSFQDREHFHIAIVSPFRRTFKMKRVYHVEVLISAVRPIAHDGVLESGQFHMGNVSNLAYPDCSLFDNVVSERGMCQLSASGPGPVR